MQSQVATGGLIDMMQSACHHRQFQINCPACVVVLLMLLRQQIGNDEPVMCSAPEWEENGKKVSTNGKNLSLERGLFNFSIGRGVDDMTPNTNQTR